MGNPTKVRRRGVVLTPAGLQRLNAARRRAEIQENDGDRFTLEELCDRTQLSLKTITKVLDTKTTVDRQTIDAFFCAFGLILETADYCYPAARTASKTTASAPTLSSFSSPTPRPPLSTPALTAADSISPLSAPEIWVSWGEAPDVSNFHGRQAELEQLQQWVGCEGCRLVGILGMGGMGKTALVTKLARRILDGVGGSDFGKQGIGRGERVLSATQSPGHSRPFSHIIWRSLRNAPSRDTIVSDWLSILSQRTETEPNGSRLIHYLQTQRCLLILDNFETILNSGRAGNYRSGYADYGELLHLLGSTQHQSCLILTSREKVLELVPLEGETLPVRCLTLQGCREAACQLIHQRGLIGNSEQISQLCDRYGSSPLAIQIIAATIRDLFDGAIETFLEQDALLFNGLRRLLDQQFERLSPLEQAIMFWLAINRDWTTLEALRDDLLLPVSQYQILEAVESLHWRSLIEKQSGAYTQQPVVMEYVTERLTEQASAEILEQRQAESLSPFLRCYALLKATAKDYIRATQSRLILEPICNLLQTKLLSRRAVSDQLKAVLAQYQATSSAEIREAAVYEVEPSYGAGNLLNLLCHLGADLTGINVSGLAVWQAYLPNVPLSHANFAHTDVRRSQLTDTFGAVFAAVFSPDGQHFITGELGGNLRCWRTHDGQAVWMVKACNTRIHSLAFLAASPDGAILAMGSGEAKIEFWEAATGRSVRSLSGHRDQVYSVDFHPDGNQLASASCDGTLRLWDISSGRCIHVLNELSEGTDVHQVQCVRFSPDGSTLISGGSDHTVRIWDVSTKQLRSTLSGHSDHVLSVAIHPNGRLLASGSADGTVKLWCLRRGVLMNSLSSSMAQVLSVRFSPDGALLTASSSNGVICLWETQTWQLANRLHHSHWIRTLAFSPDGTTLLSGSSDYTIKLWDVATGHLLKTWSGCSNWIWAIAWSPDGTRLVSGGGDHTVRIWDVDTRQCLQTLRGHTRWMLAVACNPDFTLVAGGGGNNFITLWNAENGQVFKTLTGQHTSQIFSLQFSPTAPILASSSADYSICLWHIVDGQPLKTLRGHHDWVRSVAFSPEGDRLVSVGQDGVMNLWEVSTGSCLKTWRDFDTWIWSVDFHPDGDRVVTASGNTLTLWDIHADLPLQTYTGHTQRIRSVAVSPDGRWLASCGQDNLIHLWDTNTGAILQTLTKHDQQVMSVQFSPAGRYLASGSADETIVIWDLETGQPWKMLKPEGLYEGMNISGIQGLSEEAIATLEHLGAIREHLRFAAEYSPS